jgi:ribonuclease M5
MKKRIEEIIVVEGKDDTKRLKEIYDVDTIETIGSAINDEILERIEHAEEVRGVIVFTDPDYSGEKIRRTIMEHIPTAKHAFLKREDARPGSHAKGRSLGVEHASPEAIKEALEKVVTSVERKDSDTFDEKELHQKLLQFGLINGSGAKIRREKLGEELRIGYTNGKQLAKRLQMFQITPVELEDAMKKVEEELADE